MWMPVLNTCLMQLHLMLRFSLRKALTHLTRQLMSRSALDAKVDRAGTIPDTLVYLENADGLSLKPSTIHVLRAKHDYLSEKVVTP